MFNSISLEVVAIALTYINAHDRDIWLKVGNALKTEFGEAAFAVFDNWSQTADNYDAKAVKSTWKGYTLGKNRMGTIIHHAKQNGFDIDKYESKPVSPQEQAERQAKRQQAEREAEALEQAEKVVWAKLLPQIERVTNTALSTPFAHTKGVSTTQTSSIHSNELHAFKHPFNTHNGKPESIGYALKGLVTLVPYLDLKTGELVKLQGISGIKATEGKEAGKYIKRFIGKGDGYYWRGDILKQDAPKVIIEGFSDAQTVYEYTNNRYASLAAGNDTALMKAALSLRALCPSAVIIVFGDNDLSGKGQRLAKAAALAVNGICLLPPSQYKDANEWVLAEGAEGLNKMIDEAIEKTVTERSRAVTERSRSEKAVPPSEDGTAPNSDNVASESIADGGNGGEGQSDEWQGNDGQGNKANETPPKPKLTVVTIGQLVSMNLPPRENLLSPWLPVQGLAMVYAPRGIGKTFFALNVAYAVASGGEFLGWQAAQAQPVLYIDGEMPVISMQERLGSIIDMHQAEANENALRIITPDLQGDAFMPDLATIEGQQAIEPFLEGVKLIVIDNISTLCRSGRENESEGWITVQEWALRQRSTGRSVLFVHHAGKGGNQRGTSKREDVLDTVINLKRPIDYNPSEGASFEIHFEKARGFSGEDAEPLSCRLGHDEYNNLAWLYSRLEDTTFDKVVTLSNEGLSQAEIASELDIHKSSVSKHLKKARLQGLIQEPKTKSKPVNSANYSHARDGE